MADYPKLVRALREASIDERKRAEVEKALADGAPAELALASLDSVELLTVLAGAEASLDHQRACELFDAINSQLVATAQERRPLSSETGRELLATLAGVDAAVSAPEADRLFDAIRGRLHDGDAVKSHGQPGDPDQSKSRTSPRPKGQPSNLSRAWPVAAAAGFAAIVLAVGLVWFGHKPPVPDSTFKGPMMSTAPAVRLRLFAGAQSDRGPRVTRELANGSTLDPDEVVLFRIHVDRPGYVSLAVQDGPESTVIWAPEKMMSAGEHEIADTERALGYRPNGDSTGRLRFVIISAKTRAELDQLEAVGDFHTLAIRGTCDLCTFDAKELIRIK